jgi:uncharacterized protein
MSLSEIVWSMNLEKLQQKLAEGADPREVKYDEPVFHSAIEKNWAEGLKVLLEAGADINAKSERGDTALMLAVIHKKPECAKVLVEAGADLEMPNKIGHSPLNYVARMNAGLEMTMTRWTEENGVRTETVLDPEVPRQASMAVARILMEAGANIDSENSQGMTGLHHAASAGDLEYATLLVDGGAKVSHGNSSGYQAIHAASGGGQVEMARLLMAHGADPSAADTSGFTPLHDAAAAGNKELAELLLEKNADRTVKIIKGWKDLETGMTPADVARVKGHSDVEALLA